RWCARTRSAGSAPAPSRANLRIGVPRVLNLWSTHQFWMGLFGALGVDPRNVVFSSDTSEEQGRQFGKGRGTVDCCYPVKCISGHYGELVFGQRQKLDILFSPMIYTLPSFLSGHVARTLTCPRVMAAPENIKAGFLKERDVFAEQGIRYVTPFVSLDEPLLVPKQLFEGLREGLPGLTLAETARAVDVGYQPTYTPVQQIVERSRTMFFSFQDLDSTKPAGSVKIRVETITHYLEKYAKDIIAKKKAAAPPACPLGGGALLPASP